ncbi:MAG: phage holin family protein [archaeon]|jgi:hypothetical protein
MAKAKQESGVQTMISSFMGNIRENFIGMIGKTVKEKIRKLEKMALEIAMSFVFLFIALIFVLISLMFFLKEYLGFSYSLSFLCVGLLALLIAFFIYKLVNNE